MKLYHYLFFFWLTSLVACSTTLLKPASIVTGPSALPPVHSGVLPALTTNYREYYTVKKGDNLYRIAVEHSQNYQDLEAWNKLKNPSDIKVGQVLRVIPPAQLNRISKEQLSIAQTQAVTTGIVIEKGMSQRPLVSLNGVVSTPSGNKVVYSDEKFAEMKKAAASPVPTTKTTVASDVVKSSTETAITWAWPTDGKVIADFEKTSNKGIDIAGTIGQPVFAAAAGKVMYAGSGIQGYGNLVIVQHQDGWLSVYANNKTILVKEKQNVEQGQKIAEVGGNDNGGSGLHFEIRLKGKPVDPLKYLTPR